MVEYSIKLNTIFGSLADPTRRDILRRVAEEPLTISQIAGRYDMSLAAVSKHIKVLERARLVQKHRVGTEHVVHLSAQALADVDRYLSYYRTYWEGQLDRLDSFLRSQDAQTNGGK